MIDRKQALRDYKEKPPAMGVYRVRDAVSGGYLLGSSLNLTGILNRTRFSLEMGNDRCVGMQRAWNEHGPDAFVFEVLDTLEPSGEPGADAREELAVLEDMWRMRLAATDGPAWEV